MESVIQEGLKKKLSPEALDEVKKEIAIFVGESFGRKRVKNKKGLQHYQGIHIIVARNNPISIRKEILKQLKKHTDRKDGHCRLSIKWQKTEYTLERRIIEVKENGYWFVIKGKYDVTASKEGLPYLYCHSENFVNEPYFVEFEKVPTFNDLPHIPTEHEDPSNPSDQEKIADRLFCSHVDNKSVLDLCKDCRKFICEKCSVEFHSKRGHTVKRIFNQ